MSYQVTAKEKAGIAAVRKFCGVPYAQHGQTMVNGRWPHDWATLVTEIAGLNGLSPTTEQFGNAVAFCRTAVPNRPTTWDSRANSDGMHEYLLAGILEFLGQQAVSKAPYVSDSMKAGHVTIAAKYAAKVDKKAARAASKAAVAAVLQTRPYSAS